MPLWKKDAPTGQAFMSDDAYGHLCTVAGALWTPQGRSFNGLADEIDIATSTAFDISDAITIEGWLQITTVVNMAGFLSRSTGWVVRESPTGQLSFLPFINAGWQDGGSITPLSTNQWSHIVFTYSSISKQALGYLNADLKNTTIFSGFASYLLGTGAAIVQLGYDVLNGIFFNGQLGEVRIYNRVLSALEIQALYHLTKWRYR